ncbi:MAG TPA: M48 family metalloprotease, partial [Burkholderiales bacterium]
GVFVDKVVFRTERGVGPGFYITVVVCEIVFGILASMIVAWFSRQREFRADAASADLLGSPRPMIHALARLGGLEPGALPPAIQTAGITNKPSGIMALFSTHPPVEQRIAALQSRAPGQV